MIQLNTNNINITLVLIVNYLINLVWLPVKRPQCSNELHFKLDVAIVIATYIIASYIHSIN